MKTNKKEFCKNSMKEMEEYFFPNEEIKKIKAKYFEELKSLIGKSNFYGYKKFSDDDRALVQEKYATKIEKFINKNKTIHDSFVQAYHLSYIDELAEVILHSIVVDEVINTKDKKYDVYFDDNSLLYFDDIYPPLARQTKKITNILKYCEHLQNAISLMKEKLFY